MKLFIEIMSNMWTKSDINRSYWSAIALAAIFLLTGGPARAQVVEENPREFEGIGVEEHLGERVPPDLQFTDEQGQPIRLADYLGHGRPIVLNLVYYQCPMLCNLVLNGIGTAAKQLDWTPGNQYEMVAISFNPKETPDLASAKKASYLHELDKPGAETGWHFLTGPESQSKALAESLGFHFRYDETAKEYVHTAVTFVLSPDGRISRYLYGIEYSPRDLKLALLEASEGKTGSTLDKLILYCFHYDPQAKGYVLFAGNVMKIGGGLSVAALGLFLGFWWRRDRNGRRGMLPAARLH